MWLNDFIFFFFQKAVGVQCWLFFYFSFFLRCMKNIENHIDRPSSSFNKISEFLSCIVTNHTIWRYLILTINLIRRHRNIQIALNICTSSQIGRLHSLWWDLSHFTKYDCQSDICEKFDWTFVLRGPLAPNIIGICNSPPVVILSVDKIIVILLIKFTKSSSNNSVE